MLCYYIFHSQKKKKEEEIKLTDDVLTKGYPCIFEVRKAIRGLALLFMAFATSGWSSSLFEVRNPATSYIYKESKFLLPSYTTTDTTSPAKWRMPNVAGSNLGFT